MNRFKRELMTRGVIGYHDRLDEYDVYEQEEQLLTFSNDFIVTVFYCNTLEPQFNIYDKHFNIIGSQSSVYDGDFFGQKATNPWLATFYK